MKATTLLLSLLPLLALVTSTPAALNHLTPRDDTLSEEEALQKAADDAAALKAQQEYEARMKYFHEPGSHEEGSDPLLGHYDTRFFKGKLSYNDKRAVQVHMMRAYLDTFRRKGIETWIAHGTLLGWWWNALMLPWDWDIDTQVMESTLFWLGKEMNGTEVTYNTTIDGEERSATYLMDVNPASAERSRGDGFNIIDARWINVENGMYIDITGLSELEKESNPGVISCKNGHEYNYTDVHPLRDSEFEGVQVQVPYEYSKMLVDEYGHEALVRTEFEGHLWVQNKRRWVQKAELVVDG